MSYLNNTDWSEDNTYSYDDDDYDSSDGDSENNLLPDLWNHNNYSQWWATLSR